MKKWKERKKREKNIKKGQNEKNEKMKKIEKIEKNQWKNKKKEKLEKKMKNEKWKKMSNITTLKIIIIILFQNSSFVVPEAPRTIEFWFWNLKIEKLQLWHGSLMSHAGTEVFDFQVSNSKFKSFGHRTRILKNIFWRHTQNYNNNYNYNY